MLDPAEKQQARQSAEDYLVRLTTLSPNEIRQSLLDPLIETDTRRREEDGIFTPPEPRPFPEIKITTTELPRRGNIFQEGTGGAPQDTPQSASIEITTALAVRRSEGVFEAVVCNVFGNFTDEEI